MIPTVLDREISFRIATSLHLAGSRQSSEKREVGWPGRASIKGGFAMIQTEERERERKKRGERGERGNSSGSVDEWQSYVRDRSLPSISLPLTFDSGPSALQVISIMGGKQKIGE